MARASGMDSVDAHEEGDDGLGLAALGAVSRKGAVGVVVGHWEWKG
jgi:hypothetical protein